jgi:hypothetical protein
MRKLPNQVNIAKEHNDRANPFRVAAGTFEWHGRNTKYCDSFPTLEKAIEACGTCKGYAFVDLTYVDTDGYAWLVELDPQVQDTH